MLCFVLMTFPRYTRTREFVLSQESIMGNKLSKFATQSVHERIQWARALRDERVATQNKCLTLNQVSLTRDPGPMPFSFAEAIDQYQPTFPEFNGKQMGGLKEVFLACAIKQSDNDFWTYMMELAVMLKRGNSVELIKDRFCALVLWITFEEKEIHNSSN